MSSRNLLTAAVGAALIAGSLLGSGIANADGMYRVGTDIAVGDYTYTVTGSYGGSYYLCHTTRCEPGDDIIDIEVMSTGDTGYLTITSDVNYVKVRGLDLRPL